MLICEGMNGVGKTTLARIISEELNLEYVHDDRSLNTTKPGLLYYLEKIEEIQKKGKPNYVYDRFHLGEMVYPVLKGGGRWPIEAWEQQIIEYMLLQLGAVLIRCEASIKFIYNKYESGKETFITFEQVPQEQQLFDVAFSGSLLPCIKYNPEFDNTQRELFFSDLKVLYANAQRRADL